MSIHEQIRDILLSHRGKQNPIKSKDIAIMVGEEWGMSGGNIRPKITDTIKQYHLPIAGNPAIGYYLIENREELNETIKSLDSRINGITNRKAFIFHFFHTFHNLEPLELTGEILEDPDLDEQGDTLDI